MKTSDFIVFLGLILFPIIRMLLLKFEWKWNKWLFIDMYIPKEDREKIKELFYE